MATPVEYVQDDTGEEPEDYVQAPTFPDPEPLVFSEEEQKKIAEETTLQYNRGVMARTQRAGDHLVFDRMFTGKEKDFDPRTGPWDDSANLHVQMPYWCVDAMQARMVYTIWSQNPLVQSIFEEDDDEKTGKDAARVTEWNLQPRRMNAEEIWRRLSKIRFIHGNAVGGISYVHDTYRYRTVEQDPFATPRFATNPDGTFQEDDYGEQIPLPPEQETKTKEGTLYRGPVFTPYEWDDIIPFPVDCINLQPKRLKNPLGADEVIVREWERLDLMIKKSEVQYSEMMKGRDREQWLNLSPDQARSGGSRAGGTNNERIRQIDDTQGIDRSQDGSELRHTNPEYEVLTRYANIDVPGMGREEVVIYVSKNPEAFLGAFLLSDLCWTGKRPLVELAFQTVSTQWYAMGVCEIVRSLSEELDTIHNMRVDVGMATNLPWFFAKASSAITPSEITLEPLKIIPVDDPRNITSPHTQNVTTFYHQEETLLLTIIERVMGIADLFLGISPQSGASARHATGWMGQKQEAEARLASVLAQDSAAFGFMCGLIHDMEVQFGPKFRNFRLLGEAGEVEQSRLSRDDLWFKGVYDFRLGANVGMFSQHNRFQRAQAAYNIAAQSPLTMQDMGRRWEVENEVYKSMGYRDHEIKKFIGSKESISQGESVSQSEENAQMAQFKYGVDKPAPVHPNDNDQEHLEDLDAFLGSPHYNDIGRPNLIGYLQHRALHHNAIAEKAVQAQMAQAMQGQEQGTPAGGASPEARAQAQIPGGAGGSMENSAGLLAAQTSGAGGGNGGVPSPPNLNGGSLP